MRNKWVWLLGLALVVGGLAAVNLARLGSSAAVGTVTASTGVVTESVFAGGRFQSAAETSVYAELSGRVAAVHVKPGAAVAAGDPLMTYDTQEWERQLEELRDQLAIARLTREAERRRSFEAARGQAGAAAADDIAAAEENARRLHELQVASTERSIAELTRHIREAVVAAPSDGVVTAAVPASGSRASPGMELFRLADVSQLVVRAALSELDAGKVRPGMKAIVTGDAFEEAYEGELTFVSPTASPAGMDGLDYEVGIEVSLPRGAVPPETAKPGFAATLEFRLDGEAKVLVPIDAVRYAGAEAYVFRALDGAAARTVVTLGRDDGERIEVLSGLASGETIIHPVPQGLREGDAVKAETAE